MRNRGGEEKIAKYLLTWFQMRAKKIGMKCTGSSRPVEPLTVAAKEENEHVGKRHDIRRGLK